jgi:thymidylate synthase ThyX
MKVTLISHTQDAQDILMFTKATRLTMSPSLMEEIKERPHQEKMDELEYMANTIPSSWEFVDYVFLVEGVSRAYTHQQVRTRQASYAQQTMRVLDMGEFEYIYSDKIAADPVAVKIVDDALDAIKVAYTGLINMGHAVEDARGVLPTNISTKHSMQIQFAYVRRTC